MSHSDVTLNESQGPTHGFDLQLVFDTFDLPTFALDADGRVVAWDSQIAELLGKSREAVIGETGLGAKFYDDGQRNLTLAEKIVEAPRRTDEEFPEVDRADDDYALLSGDAVYEDTSTIDGQEVWFVAAPVYRSDEFVGVIEIVQDVTNSERYQRELESLFSAVIETVNAYEHGNFDARVSFDVTNSILEDELLRIVENVNEMGEAVGDLVAEVQADVEELDHAASDIAKNSERINSLSTGQAESMSEVASEVSNLSATVEEIASTTDTVAAQASEAEDLAATGSESAQQAATTMERVATSADDVADDVEILREKIEDIDEIVEIINDIADQTNLLALNASIEAARAGEAGEGFAVVADEVKSLAEDSQRHATEIEETVSEIRAETEETVESLETTTDELDDGIDEVETAMARFEDVVAAVADATDGIQQVSEATDDQAASAEEIAAMVDEANDQAETISAAVDDIVASTEEQAAMVEDLNDSVTRLAADERT
ncbi:MAG: methyl-accepting chemotaxis protein [Haloferacaceae archaeon]